jgi:PAS domain S-box-containing protein
MPLLKHFSGVLDSDTIVNNIYPVVLKMLNHQVDAVIEWECGSPLVSVSHRFPFEIPQLQPGNTLFINELKSFVPPQDWQEIVESYNLLLNNKRNIVCFNSKLQFPDDNSIHAELMAACVLNHNGEPVRIITLVRDFSKLQRANDEIRELTLAIENAMTGIAWLDREGNFQMVKPDYAKLLGYTPEELIGASYKVTVAEQDQDMAYEAYLKMLSQGKFDIDLTAQRKDGSIFFKNILMIKTFDPSGKHNGHYCLMKDITGQVNYERAIRKQNEELIKINQELDNLVYRVSHDLRAPVASSRGLNDLMSRSADLSEIKNYLALQQQSLLRLDLLIDKILHYSYNSRKEINTVAVDLHELIKSTIQEEVTDPTIEVSTQLNLSTPFYSDPDRLRIILQSLLSNAIAFRDVTKMIHRVKITVDVTKRVSRFTIDDNGEGIDPALKERVFEMFFRGNVHSKGAGLGLYIARETALKLKGKISYTSELGKGTTFVLDLPNEIN